MKISTTKLKNYPFNESSITRKARVGGNDAIEGMIQIAKAL